MDLADKDVLSRSIIFQYFNSITVVLAGFLFYIYIIHYFPPELVGVVALLLAIASLFNIVFSMGLGSGAQHFISYHLGRGETGSIRQIIITLSEWAVLISLVAVAFMWFTAPVFAMLFFHTYRYTLLIQFLGFDLMAMILSSVLGGMLLGLQSFKSQAIRNIIGVIISYTSPILLFAFTRNPLVIVIGWTAGNAVTVMLFIVNIYAKSKRVSIKQRASILKPIFYYSLPIFISSLIGYGATYVDRFTVSYFLSLTEMGIYNFGLLIVSAIGFMTGPFSAILLPKFSEFYGREDRESIKLYSSKATELLLAIYLPVALLIAAIAPSILLFLSDREYLPATAPIMIILFINSAFISVNIFAPALQSVRKTKIFIMSSSLALASNFAISILLIPRFQMIGAAIGFSSIYIMSFAVLYYYVRKYELVKFEWRKLLKIYLSGILMFIIMFVVQDRIGYSPAKLALYVISGLVMYIIFIKAFRVFNDEDLNFFMKLLPVRGQGLRRYIKLLLA